jgi:hypothetical protein
VFDRDVCHPGVSETLWYDEGRDGAARDDISPQPGTVVCRRPVEDG